MQYMLNFYKESVHRRRSKPSFYDELAHLIETNHTPRFWNIVHTQIPIMEKAKAWLKENGGLLEEAI